MVEQNDTAQWRRLADELEIRNLIARLAHLADDGNLDEYMACFTDDIVWGGGGQPLRRGHAEVLAGAMERRDKGITGPGSGARHVVTTPWITLDGKRATARSVFHFYTNVNTAEPCLRALGVYDDTFVRTAGGWRLAQRILEGAAKDLPTQR